MIARPLPDTPSRPDLQLVTGRLPYPDLVPGPASGHYRKSRSGLLLRNEKPDRRWRQDLLRFLAKHVNPDIPRHYFRAVLGHDLHLSLHATLHVRHWHTRQPDPFLGVLVFNEEAYLDYLSKGFDPVDARHYAHGWWEDVGRVSRGLVTTAFRDFEALNLVTDSTTYGDFKFHRPGTSATAEANTQTALVTDAGLEATGTQTNPTASTYRSVATVTADVTETWQEHSLRNLTGAAGGTMMDRSLVTPTVSVVLNDTVEFTYTLTKNAEV